MPGFNGTGPAGGDTKTGGSRVLPSWSVIWVRQIRVTSRCQLWLWQRPEIVVYVLGKRFAPLVVKVVGLAGPGILWKHGDRGVASG